MCARIHVACTFAFIGVKRTKEFHIVIVLDHSEMIIIIT